MGEAHQKSPGPPIGSEAVHRVIRRKVGLTECRGDCVGHANGLIDHVSAPGRTRIGAGVVERDPHVGIFGATYGHRPRLSSDRSPAGRKSSLDGSSTDSRPEPADNTARYSRRMPAAVTWTRTLTAWLPGGPTRSRLITRAIADRKSAIVDAVHDAAKGMHKAGVTELVTLSHLRSWNF